MSGQTASCTVFRVVNRMLAENKECQLREVPVFTS